MISARLAVTVGWVTVRGKNFNIVIFSDTMKYDKCPTLHNDSAHWALPIHTTFNDLAFQGIRGVEHVLLKILCSYSIKLKLCIIVDYVK